MPAFCVLCTHGVFLIFDHSRSCVVYNVGRVCLSVCLSSTSAWSLLLGHMASARARAYDGGLGQSGDPEGRAPGGGPEAESF